MFEQIFTNRKNVFVKSILLREILSDSWGLCENHIVVYFEEYCVLLPNLDLCTKLQVEIVVGFDHRPRHANVGR